MNTDYIKEIREKLDVARAYHARALTTLATMTADTERLRISADILDASIREMLEALARAEDVK